MKLINGSKLELHLLNHVQIYNLNEVSFSESDNTIFNRIKKNYQFENYNINDKKIHLIFMPHFKWEMMWLEEMNFTLSENLILVYNKLLKLGYNSTKDSIVFVVCCESWAKFGQNLYTALQRIPGVNVNNVYLADERLNELEIANSIKHLNHISHSARIRNVNIEHNIPKDKLFLSFNRRVKNHRIMLVGRLIEENLMKRSLISFFPNLDGAGKNNILSCPYITDDQKSKYIEWLSTDYLLDDVDILEGNMHESSDKLIDLFKRSYFSVITETQYEGREVCITEKTYKAFSHKHPFIVLANPNFLKYVRKLGYKTFHPFINESYDLIENHHARFEAVILEMNRLASLSIDQLKELLNQLSTIIEHNYNIQNNNFDYIDNHVTTLCPVIDTFEVKKVNKINANFIYADNNAIATDKIIISRRTGGILKLKSTC